MALHIVKFDEGGRRGRQEERSGRWRSVAESGVLVCGLSFPDEVPHNKEDYYNLQGPLLGVHSPSPQDFHRAVLSISTTLK